MEVQASSLEKVGKLKILLTECAEHPLFDFMDEIKKRKSKNIDVSQIVLDALSQVHPDWWQKKIEELTPLEYRVDMALNDPILRDKLTDFLKTEKKDTTSSVSTLN